MFKRLKELRDFLTKVAEDPRIPGRDKKMILVLLALIVSPVDLIPDWIPVVGALDDLVILAIILDYFFTVLDPEIVRSHYPWSDRSFMMLRMSSRWVSRMVPGVIKKRLWKYPQ